MKRWIGLAVAGSVLCVAPLFFRGGARADEGTTDPGESEELSKQKTAGFEKKVTPPPLTGLDLVHAKLDDEGGTATAHGARVAHLTLDNNLQRFARRALEAGGAPEAAVVVTDVKTGRVLVYAGHIEGGGGQRDVIVESNAPAASVFKIITASSLVEQAGLSADTRQCYWGGEHRIEAANLIEDPRKDKWCATMAEAMGRSLNTVFARLSQKNLDAEKLGGTARSYGFGEPLPFDVPVAADTITIPDDALGFARTSAGFWNTTLSPLGGAELAMTIANRGLRVRPYVVESVTDGEDKLYRAPHRQVLGRAVKPETADQVTKMMEATVSDGTSYKAFHDGAGRPYLPGVQIAGKTGTLTKQTTDQFYTWFVGFAPSRSPEVAISVLVVNHSTWKVKANTIARQVLQSYFAAHGAPGVQPPKLSRRTTRRRGKCLRNRATPRRSSEPLATPIDATFRYPAGRR